MWLVGGVVRRYIDFFTLLIPIYSTCISSFLQQHPYFVHLKSFFHSYLLFLCISSNIANVAQRRFEIVQNSKEI